ncbi:glycoside hydrolase family 10 protein [Spongiimicrobium sp. 3-5]|uniref:glycoside hydrolase family 10 protein n=1 Tax=Spongiimicrobium sp. 3-5 TaxID=3332596 RepID=UPI0039810D12
MIKRYCVILIICLTSCGVFTSNIPQPKREFRGVWIATVANIDWPKKGTDAVSKQKSDYLTILNFYKDLNFNAVIVQIRTAGDALYTSQLAPWSRFLTGTEGIPPNGNEDILPWMIKEAHKQGFEFHAWLNPYRATLDSNTKILSESHDYYKHPEWMIKYGEKHYYNPGIPEVRSHLLKVMDEVVLNYDIDAVHFDDYFYPYKIKDEVFNDSLAYVSYALPQQTLEDWRRSNVDSLVQGIHKNIKKKKPWVQFGISPFGVWKNKATDPKGSDTQAGQTTYEDLYADPLLWMEKGWIDYLVPQVYWSMDLNVASHRKIVSWWAENSENTNLYIGNGAYKIYNNSDPAWEKKKELPQQLKLSRNTAAVSGNVFFSAKSLMKEREAVVRNLKRNFYKNVALPPASPLMENRSLNIPKLKQVWQNRDSLKIAMDFSGTNSIRNILIYASRKDTKLNTGTTKQLLRKLYHSGEDSFQIAKKDLKGKRHLALTFLDRYGNESTPIELNLNQTTNYDTKK